MIWLALLIPVLAIGFLAWKFPKKMNILEYVLLFLVPIICIVVGKYTSVHSQTKDAEYWNSYGTRAMYEEQWKERWTEVETYYVTVGSGKNARTESRTRTVTKRRTHPEKWTLFDNIGDNYNISRKHFDQLCVMWNNKTFKDMQRHRTTHTITKDGDAYVTAYDNVLEHTVTLCNQHSYKNKVQCSKSVFNFQDVSPESKSQYKLFEYPPVSRLNYNPILGHKNTAASKKLQIHNALNGSRRQLHMLLVVFKNQPLEAGLFQESYWVGGNKNEFIVCVGTKGNDIKWTKVISWTTNEELKVKTARHIKEMKKFDVNKVVDYMAENVPKQFVRRHFEEFSYITVRPSTRAIVITFLITLLTTVIIALVSVLNEHGFGTFIKSGRNRNRNRNRNRYHRR